ncbi:MAG: chromosomal replication initiator protein DnaA [Alphaproteobacteria bacterium]
MAGVVRQERDPSWQEIWTNARDQLRIELGQGVFDSWIAPLSLTKAECGHVELSAPGNLIRDYVASKLALRLERAFTQQTKSFSSLVITVAPAEARMNGAVNGVGHVQIRKVPPQPQPQTGGSGIFDREPDGQQSFENFVTGPSNELAYRAVRRFAEGNDGDIAILYLHGDFGYGKTHLLNAIALEIRRSRGGRPLFLRAEDFMIRFIGAVRGRETLAFKEDVRSAEVLLLDDLQHICGKPSTVSEFLHTLNAFTDLRRKIVIAADRAPVALEGLPDDVRSRLQGALTVEVGRPDAATRLAILKLHAADQKKKYPRVQMPDEVLEYVAKRVDISPRELIGLLRRMFICADLNGGKVTIEAAEQAISTHTPHSERKISVEEIQRKTAEFYKLHVEELHSPRRARRVARPRQIAMYLSRELTSRSLPDIGKRFGGRDHTTVLHACRRIEELRRTDPALEQEVEFLRRILKHS